MSLCVSSPHKHHLPESPLLSSAYPTPSLCNLETSRPTMLSPEDSVYLWRKVLGFWPEHIPFDLWLRHSVFRLQVKNKHIFCCWIFIEISLFFKLYIYILLLFIYFLFYFFKSIFLLHPHPVFFSKLWVSKWEYCSYEIHQTGMPQIMFLMSFESSRQGGVHGLGSMM